MIIKRKSHRVPGLNTTSTADISFMLLIFFLVTTSMDVDKGLAHLLPPKRQTPSQETEIDRRNLMAFRLLSGDKLMLNGAEVSEKVVGKTLETFILGLGKRHLITIETASETSYEAYFKLQNEITRAYARARNKLAESLYNKRFNACTTAEKEQIAAQLPYRVAENYPTSAEGGAR